MRPRTPDLDHRILDAAARLFAGNHFHQVRMEDIAVEATVGKGTLYRYFKDKEELYLALLARAAVQFPTAVDREMKLALDPEEKLTAVVRAILNFFAGQPHLFEVIQQTEARLGTNHPWQPAREFAVALVQQIFCEGRQFGYFDIADPEIAALVLLGGVRAVIRFGGQPLPDDCAERIAATILHGAAKPVKRRVAMV